MSVGPGLYALAPRGLCFQADQGSERVAGSILVMLFVPDGKLTVLDLQFTVALRQ